MQVFGSTLRAIREGLGLSQLELAARIGSTQRHLSFLETGRSSATRAFLHRLCLDLDLSAAQRGMLFDAAGFRNPFPTRPISASELAQAMHSIEHRILKNWPFPAFALDQNWTILCANRQAKVMFAAFDVPLGAHPVNLADVVLSEAFRNAVVNWREASLGMYFRLRRASAETPVLAEKFAAVRARGIFDDVADLLTGQSHVTPLSPVILEMPDGRRLQISPFVGKLTSIQDATLEGVEIELMVPLDDPSEAALGALGR